MTGGRIEESDGADKASPCAGAGGPVVILAGPTASGKSALAMDLAEMFGGAIVNADSMQVYRDLPILTAQPDAAARARVPHHLYGFMRLAETCDAQSWARFAVQEIGAIQAGGRLPIVVGGTGLYLNALTAGFSPVPDIPEAIRAQARREVASDAAEIYARLRVHDPVLAARLPAGDRQRIARAWEVWLATGKALSWWQAQPRLAPTRHRFLTLALMPERQELYAGIDARFLDMIARGAVDEVRIAESRRDASEGSFSAGSFGGRKALGYAELAALAAGRLEREAALSAAQTASRRYAKRQMTWLRHQMPDANFISPDRLAMKFSQSSMAEMRQKIRDFMLTH